MTSYRSDWYGTWQLLRRTVPTSPEVWLKQAVRIGKVSCHTAQKLLLKVAGYGHGRAAHSPDGRYQSPNYP